MAQTAQASKPQQVDTGVPNLDLVLGGGLQKHNSYIFAGPSGSGKSVLTQQIAFHRARQGDRVLFVTGLDEPHHNLLEHFSTLRFADYALVGPQIETVSLVPFLDRPVPEKIDVLRKTVLNSRPQLVTIDGLRSLQAYMDGEEAMYQFIYGLTSWFAVEGITLLLGRDTCPMPTTQTLPRTDTSEFGLVDGVVFMQRMLTDSHTVRQLWVWKMRGQQPLQGLHTYTIDENGITVWPRPEATFQPAERPESHERMEFGMTTMDQALAGGLPAGTSTLLAGDPGTGKTVSALIFLGSGVQHGQPGLWLGFREGRTHLLETSRQWSEALSKAEGEGRAQFMILPPFEQDLDRLAGQLQNRIAETGARRLVVDAAELLDSALGSQQAAHRFLAWLTQYAPQVGLTVLITSHLPRIAGEEFDVTGAPGATLADNVILLRQIRERAQLRRAFAVIKMSGAGYDTTIREFTVDRYGITLGQALEIQEGQPVPGPV